MSGNKTNEIAVRNKFTIITFFCSILVIWIHTNNLEIYGIDQNATGLARFIYILEDTWGNLTQSAVPFFFFVSGYLFYRSFEISKVKEKYKARVFSILIPYLIWCSIYYLYFVLLTNIPVVREFINTERVTLSLGAWLKALWPNEYYTLWFLKEIIVYILACPLLYFIYKNKKGGFVILSLLMMNAQFKLIVIPFSGLLYYSLGTYLALNFKGLEYFSDKNLSGFSLAFLAILICTRFRIVESPIIMILYFFMFWFVLDFFPLQKRYPWWMKITFFTYVGHDIILEAYEKVFFLVFGRNIIVALCDYIFAPLLVFGTLVAIAAFFNKFMPDVWKVCTGNR